MASPKISVIVPVYNVESYVVTCVQSVRRQTLEDIEIICVNDGSKDASRRWLSILAAVDPRIRVIDQENQGLSAARNTGIRAARADYVCFLDSDDFFKEDACETIVHYFEKTDADVITYGAETYPNETDEPWYNDILSPRYVMYEGFAPSLLFEEKSHPFAWRTACKRDFLIGNDILFDETVKFGEDQVFHFEVYPKAAVTLLIPDKLLYYRVTRKGSLMAGFDDWAEKLSEHIEITSTILRQWKRDALLDRYKGEMFAWAFDFMGHDVLLFNGPQRDDLITRYRDLLIDVGMYDDEKLAYEGAFQRIYEGIGESPDISLKQVKAWVKAGEIENNGRKSRFIRRSRVAADKLNSIGMGIRARIAPATLIDAERDEWEKQDLERRTRDMSALLEEYDSMF